MNNRIKKVRKMLDLTQQAFAEKIGLKQNSIALIESGKRNTSDQVILSICREFNVNEEWLRNGTGEMFRAEPTDELDALSVRYNLKHKDYVFLEKLLKNAAFREQLEDFCLDYAMDMMYGNVDGDVPAIPSGSEATDIDIDAAVESYRRTLELQKKVAEESSASNGTRTEDKGA